MNSVLGQIKNLQITEAGQVDLAVHDVVRHVEESEAPAEADVGRNRAADRIGRQVEVVERRQGGKVSEDVSGDVGAGEIDLGHAIRRIFAGDSVP